MTLAVFSNPSVLCYVTSAILFTTVLMRLLFILVDSYGCNELAHM